MFQLLPNRPYSPQLVATLLFQNAPCYYCGKSCKNQRPGQETCPDFVVGTIRARGLKFTKARGKVS